MRRIVALVSGFGWHTTDLRRAAESLGVELLAVPFPSLSSDLGAAAGSVHAGEVDLARADGVLVRMMPPGSLEQVVFRMDALHRLESLGVPILNPPRAIETAVDKYLTLVRLERHGLPVPETWVGETPEAALTAFERLGGDVVIKPIFGSEGRGIIRVSDPEIAWRAVHAVARMGGVIYLQKYIRHPGHDLRVFVVGDRVIGAIRRVASVHEWRTNVALGGRATPWNCDKDEARLSLEAARSVGARIAGVDLMWDPARDGYVVIEVNAVPGWKALSAATGVDVAATLIHELLRDARR